MTDTRIEIPGLDPLYTERQFAKYAGIAEGTARNWRVEGRGPTWVKLGQNGAIRYRASDIEAWIAEGVSAR